MKVIDFKESKAKKNGEVTVKSLIEHLLIAIENGTVESVTYVAKNKDGELKVGCNNMSMTEAIGMLECGKQLIIDDMYE